MVAVPDGDHEVAAEEDHDLPGLDDLLAGLRAAVADGLEHHEQRVVVALELGPLVGVHRVLDGQLVQPEDLRDPRDLLLGRLVQPDPHESVVPAAYLGERAVVGEPSGQADAVDVDGAVDHVGRQRHVELRQQRRPRPHTGGAEARADGRQRRHGDLPRCRHAPRAARRTTARGSAQM
jgi:hypothetical protein